MQSILLPSTSDCVSFINLLEVLHQTLELFLKGTQTLLHFIDFYPQIMHSLLKILSVLELVIIFWGSIIFKFALKVHFLKGLEFKFDLLCLLFLNQIPQLVFFLNEKLYGILLLFWFFIQLLPNSSLFFLGVRARASRSIKTLLST